jgi:hypothetical protein
MLAHAVNLTAMVASDSPHRPGDKKLDNYEVGKVARELGYTIAAAQQQHGVVEAERILAASYADKWMTAFESCCDQYFDLAVESDPVVIQARQQYLGDTTTIATRLTEARDIFRKGYKRGEISFLRENVIENNNQSRMKVFVEQRSEAFDNPESAVPPWVCGGVIRTPVHPSAVGNERLTQFANRCVAAGGAAAVLGNRFLNHQAAVRSHNRKENVARKQWQAYFESAQWQQLVAQVRREAIQDGQRKARECGLYAVNVYNYSSIRGWAGLRESNPKLRPVTDDPKVLRQYAIDMLRAREANHLFSIRGEPSFEATPFAMQWAVHGDCPSL